MSEFETNETSHIMMDESTINNAKVKVFGVGGAGGNTVNRMVGMKIAGVEYYAVNTDAKALELSMADHKIAIGQKTTKTLGAGAKPDVGCKAAEENIEELKEAMKGADMIFITAGMGGGTGTGAAPVIGTIAREMGILAVAVVTKPFRYEGPVRSRNAAKGIKELRDKVDTMIVVDNEKLMGVVQSTDKTLTLDGAFRLTDEILGNAVRSICDIMFRHGLIHVDFADIRTVMTNGGSALMGTGIAEGENRGIRAVDMALSSPLLEDVNVEGATGVLVNVSHGENFSMLEYNEAMEHIHEAVSDKNDPNIIMGEHIYKAVGDMGDPNIIIGDILLPELGEKVCITVIATGCGGSAAQQTIQQATAQRTQDIVNTIGAPSVGFQQPAPAPQAPVIQPGIQQATPRPTTLNFAALAHNTVAMPAVAPEARTMPMDVMPAQAPAAPVEEAKFASAQFNAKAQAEEELVFTTVSSQRDTEEMSAMADVDTLSNGDYSNPANSRQTVSEPVMQPAQEDRSLKYPENSLKTNGIDYNVPAFLRLGDNDLF